MIIAGHNTERSTATATPPASSARRQNPSHCANPSPNHPTHPHFPPAIAAISNRHSLRLEIAISPRKQTLASRSNRHKMQGWRVRFQRSTASVASLGRALPLPAATGLALRRVSRAFPAISNRHTSRLASQTTDREPGITSLPRRQAGHESQITNRAVCVPDAVAGHVISNRQWQILENAVSHRKQTFASRSNRQLFAIFQSESARVIFSDRPAHIARRTPLPNHYNSGVLPCRATPPTPVLTP